MTTYKKSIRLLACLALLFVLAACLSAFDFSRFLLRKPATLFLMGMSLALLLYFSARIIDPGVRRWLTAVAGMLCFLFILRGAKYIAFEETEWVARHIWYLYYVPALTIPLFSLYAAFSVQKRPTPRQRAAMRAAAGITALLILCVLFNDLHQWVFRFRPGFEDWDASYTHGGAFFLLYLWMVLQFAAAFWILLRRCRLSASRRLAWIPLLPVAFGVVYLVLYALDLWPRLHGALFGEFPEALAFTMAGVWMSLIRIGLIPSNEGYDKLFEASGLAAQIADGEHRVIYRSAHASTLTPQQLASPDTVMLDENTRLHRKAVRGGWVYWQDDVSQLSRVNAELEETRERLQEEAELLRLENALKEERSQIEARLRVYDAVSAQVRPQSARIGALCAHAEAQPDSFEHDMREVCLLGAYIKRYANLSLLAADSGTIELQELYLAVAESLRQLGEMGIPALAAPGEKRRIPAQTAVAAYARFEALLEQALPALRGVYVTFTERELKLTLEGVSALDAPGAVVLYEDGSAYLRLPLGEEARA